MKISEDVRQCAGKQGVSKEEAIQKSREAESKAFLEKGAEVYAKA